MLSSKPQTIRWLLILACLISLLVFLLPGVISPRAGAANSPHTLRPTQAPLRKALSPLPAALLSYDPMASLAGSSLTRGATRLPLSPLMGLAAPIVTANKSVALFNDADGDLLISPGDTLKYTVGISVSGMDATGVDFSDTLDANLTLVPGSVHASPLAFNDTYNWVGNTILDTSARGLPSATANDVAVTDGFTLTTLTNAPTTAGGTVTLGSNGHFTYTPPVGFTGVDTFNYTLTNNADASLTDTGTVTINLPVRVWYAQNATVNGNGLSNSPFNNPASASTAANASTDIIYIFSDIGANPKLNGNFALDNGQQLLGQGVNLVANSITLFTAGAAPTTTNSAGNGITVASGNTIRGLIVGDCSGIGINGSGFGTLTVSDTTINNGIGQALGLTTGTLAATFGSISSTNSSTTGISLSAVGGSLTTSSTTITNPTGVGIQVQSAPAGATLNFGSTAVSGSGSTGVVLGGAGVGNVGNVAFGALNITPNANQRGLLAQDNSGTITTTSGAISTSGASAVEISRTSGTTPLVISLTGVSANGGTSGILLTNTSGSFTVTGDAGSTNNSSGGTLQNLTSHGIDLTNAQNVSLDQMNIQSTGGSGVNGTAAINFSFTNGTINNSGNAVGESNIAFNGNGTLTGNNLSGTLTVTGSTLTNAFDHGIHVEGNDGTISNAIIQNNIITSTTSTATSKGTGIQMVGKGTATTVSNLTKATISGNTVRNFPSAAGIRVTYGNTNAAGPGGSAGTPGSGTNIISITNNVARGQSAVNRFGTNAILIVLNGGNSASRSQGNFDVSNNGTVVSPVGDSAGTAIGIGNNGNATMTATINNNVIVANNSVAANGIGGGNGVVLSNTETPNLTLTVMGNTLTQVDGNGMLLVGRGTSGFFNLKIANNVVAAPLTGVRQGIRVDAGNGASLDDGVCLNIFGNTSLGSGGAAGIGVRKQGAVATTNDFGIQGIPQTTPTNTDVQTYINAQNPLGGGTDIISGSNFVQCASAPTLANLETQGGTDGLVRPGDGRPLSAGNILIAFAPITLAEDRQRLGIENGPRLSPSELSLLAQAATERWRQAGVALEDLDRLVGLNFEVADLPSGQLATATSTTITVDGMAAGYGWFIDPSATEDTKFDVPVLNQERQTTEYAKAYGRMDLLTVLMRQMAYVIGPDKLRSIIGHSFLLDGILEPGVRRMPTGISVGLSKPGQSTQLSARASAGASKTATTGFLKPAPERSLKPFAFSSPVNLFGSNPFRNVAAAKASLVSGTVGVTIGTLPAGKSVTIVFRTMISDPMPSGVCQVSNQGTVTGTNFATVTTNTVVTQVATPPAITGATISRQQGTAASTSQIATVSDCNQAANTLAVTVNGGASATTNGVTVSSISVDGAGNVTASVVADCTASNANFNLTVTDNTNKTATATLTVNVTANTPPTLGTYPNTTVTPGGSTTATPSAAPSDNGSVVSLTASASPNTFTGTFSGNTSTGVITITNANPPGVYTVTVTATDNCGATTTTTFQLTVNTTPTITGATISRQQGTAASTSQIATVSDADQPANTLAVTVNGGASATVNGVTVSGISVDGAGNVTASVVADCTASNASFTLTVTDNVGATANATLTVNVTPNTPPTLGTYPATTVSTGGSTTVTPSAAPSDNGSVVSLTASAPGFTGTFSGNTSTGVITITSAGPTGVYTVTVTATDNCGATTTATFQLTVNTPPTITGATISRQQGTAASTSQIATVSDADQPANTLTVTVNGGASATVNGVTVSGISVDGAGNVTASVVASCSASNASFTLTVTDNQGATANATLTVNVTANTPPSLGTYPTTTVNPGGSTTVTPSAAPSDNGSVVSLTASASPNTFTGSFSGNTSTGVITITNANPPGTYTVTVTATDNCGATTTRTFTLNVNTPPTITGATITRQQGAPASVSQIATVSDPDQPANTLTVTVTPATGSGVTVSGVSVDAAGNVTASVAASCSATSSTFTVTVTDNQGASSSATLIVNVTPNTAPAVTITGPPSGSLYSVGTSVSFTGTFTDNTAGTHTAQWTFTSSSNTFTQAGTVNEGAGTVSANFTFNTAGVYQVMLTVTDACGAAGSANTVNGLLALVVIFDPDGAFVTGGGFINSPAGAYVANPSLTGQANFGLNAKYNNNDTVPKGETSFHFNAANFNFKSTSYDFLVVEGARAQYQGSGKVNNGGNYGFLVTVIDGQASGGGGVDKFRIKIWDKNNGNAVVYDSQLGDPDTANPTTPLGGGNIVIH